MGLVGTSLRLVASVMGLELSTLDVEVEGDVDLRGSLGTPGVPVGFTRMRIRTRVGLRNGGPEHIERLLATAEQCCVVGRTLRAGVPVEHVLVT